MLYLNCPRFFAQVASFNVYPYALRFLLEVVVGVVLVVEVLVVGVVVVAKSERILHARFLYVRWRTSVKISEKLT